jgi:hypothetical protein
MKVGNAKVIKSLLSNTDMQQQSKKKYFYNRNTITIAKEHKGKLVNPMRTHVELIQVVFISQAKIKKMLITIREGQGPSTFYHAK